MSKKIALKDTPLYCGIENNQLVIRIGVATLAFADKERYDDMWGKHTITDPKRFAGDVVHAMQVEEEDGSSPLTNFLDRAMLDAILDGSAWIETTELVEEGE